jgi:hypothetical protein
VTAKLALLKRIAALEQAPTHAKPLRIAGGLPPGLYSATPLVRVGRMTVIGGLPTMPGCEGIIMPGATITAEATKAE